MTYTNRAFVPTDENEGTVRLLESLFDYDAEILRMVIEGERFSGKSTLIHHVARKLEQDDSDSVFFCTGADLSIALVSGADDSFFVKLGSRKTLFVDSFELLLNHEDGQQLATLLLEERLRNEGSTIIVSGTPLKHLVVEQPLKIALEEFTFATIEPLDDLGKIEYVFLLLNEYKTDTSPELDNEAAAFLAAEAADFRSMENAVRYIFSCEDYADVDVMDVAMLKDALKE